MGSMSLVSRLVGYVNSEFDELDELSCKFDELAKLKDVFVELDKLNCKFDELVMSTTLKQYMQQDAIYEREIEIIVHVICFSFFVSVFCYI